MKYRDTHYINEAVVIKTRTSKYAFSNMRYYDYMPDLNKIRIVYGHAIYELDNVYSVKPQVNGQVVRKLVWGSK